MRVNHVGEVCAQALYASQAWGTKDPVLKAQFDAAAREETDHLAWTEQRLRELGGRTSLLNPLWYAGAFGFGLLAARAGDRVSLGFVVETERQVEDHLNSHMDRLPAGDQRSRAIVAQMRDDEIEHADAALKAGGPPAGTGARSDEAGRQGHDDHGALPLRAMGACRANQAATISKLVVISAVLPIMIEAEQYFSCDI